MTWWKCSAKTTEERKTVQNDGKKEKIPPKNGEKKNLGQQNTRAEKTYNGILFRSK